MPTLTYTHADLPMLERHEHLASQIRSRPANYRDRHTPNGDIILIECFGFGGPTAMINFGLRFGGDNERRAFLLQLLHARLTVDPSALEFIFEKGVDPIFELTMKIDCVAQGAVPHADDKWYRLTVSADSGQSVATIFSRNREALQEWEWSIRAIQGLET